MLCDPGGIRQTLKTIINESLKISKTLVGKKRGMQLESSINSNTHTHTHVYTPKHSFGEKKKD